MVGKLPVLLSALASALLASADDIEFQCGIDPGSSYIVQTQVNFYKDDNCQEYAGHYQMCEGYYFQDTAIRQGYPGGGSGSAGIVQCDTNLGCVLVLRSSDGKVDEEYDVNYGQTSGCLSLRGDDSWAVT